MGEMTLDQQRALARARARARAAQAQPAPKAPEPQQPRFQSFLSGFERGVKPVAEFVSSIDPTKYLQNAATEFFAPGSRQRAENKLAAQAQQAQRQNPVSFGGGKLAGNIVATLPVGPALGGAVRLAAGGTRAGKVIAAGLSSGGLKTGLTPTRAAIKAGTAAPTRTVRAADLAVRAGTGATTGAVTAGLTGDDAAAASAIGALIPTLGAGAGRLALDKVILPAVERLSSQFGKVRAAAILRDAFGMPIEDVINLARNAPDDVPFAKVLAQEGEDEPVVQALAARMAEGPGKPIYAPIAAAETQAQQDALNAMARGGTEREARNALVTGRKAIGETYENAEKQAFAQANQNTRTVAPLAAQAAQAEREAARQVVLARQGPLASVAALNAPQEAERLAAVAAATRQQIADLETQGIRALETAPLASQIRGMASQDGLSRTQRSALGAIADEIESSGPVISAANLDAIRSDANVTIANLLGANADVGGIKKATADLLGRIKGPIDNAIESAGGVGYKEAKAGFATGATELERQGFAGQLAGIFEADPDKFARTVRGAYGTTGTVKEAFPRAGRRNFDIQEMMGPSYMPALEDIAGQVELKGRMARDAALGDYRAGELLKKPPQEADIFHSLSPLNWAGRLGTGALQLLRVIDDTPFDAATKQALSEGLRSGRSVEDLLATIPLADRMQLKQRMASYGLFAPRNIVNAVGRNTSNAMFNAATAVPSDQNQNAMAGF